MMTLYCPDFANRFNGQNIENVMREYMTQIRKSGLRISDVRKGVERLKTRKEKWTPNPTEFVALCKPTAEELGIPDLDLATYEVRQARGRWRTSTTAYPFTHRLVELLNERVGVDIYHCSENEWRKRVKAEYERLLRLAMDNMLPPKREALTQTIADERPPFERFGGRMVRHDEVRSIIDSCKRKFHSDTNTPST